MPSLDKRDVRANLRKKGFAEEQGSRDHDFYRYDDADPVKPCYTKISYGSAKEIPSQLVSRMAKQIHLKTSQFVDLVSCELSRAEYYDLLVQKGIVEGEPSKEQSQPTSKVVSLSDAEANSIKKQIEKNLDSSEYLPLYSELYGKIEENGAVTEKELQQLEELGIEVDPQ